MSRSQADLGITAAVAVFACAAVAVAAPVPVTAVLGIALFASIGYLTSQLLLGSNVTGLERVAVATGLAFSVPILGGLLLYVARVPLHRASWLALLVGVTLVGDVALFLRRRGRSAPLGREEKWHPPIRHVVVFGAAVVIAAGAVGLARAGSADAALSRFHPAVAGAPEEQCPHRKPRRRQLRGQNDAISAGPSAQRPSRRHLECDPRQWSDLASVTCYRPLHYRCQSVSAAGS